MDTHLPTGAPLYFGPRRPKRLKIDVACDTCRSRKVKCDGARPACGNCSKRFGQKDHCRYSNSDGTPAAPHKDTSPSTYTDWPPAKNEPQKQPHPTQVSNLTNHHVPPGGDPYPSRNCQEPHSSSQVSTFRPVLPGPSPGKGSADVKHAIPRDKRTAAISDAGSVRAPDASPSAIDSMTAVVDDDVSTGEFFGSSSAGSFTSQIKAAVANRLGQAQPKPPRSGLSLGVGNLNAPRRAGMHNSANEVLPPRRQADHLMNVYWFYVDPLYPFLDRRKWEQNYANLFAGTPIDTDEVIFVATLNIIFALATQLVESMEPENRDETSGVYFKRAKDLLDLTFWDSGSLELVQYLLLMSQYLQSTNLPHQTWMIVGSAVRVAQSLGLHLPETSALQPTTSQRELLRRIWHGCVLMDRMVSLTHGRPAMISRNLASAVPLPLTSSNAKPNDYGRLTEGSFFVKSIELYEITHRVLLDLYSEPGSRPRSTIHDDRKDEDLASVMQLDSAMMKWEESLPKFLVLGDADVANNDVSHRQAVILHIRFLHARMLLLRPVVARVCLPPPGFGVAAARPPDSLQSRVMQQCTIYCVEIARSIISLLLKYQANDGTVGLLPAWWYRVYYLFSAATVLIAAKLRTDIINLQDINQAWSEAMKVLQAHEHVNTSARRCVAALQILSSKILNGGASTSDSSAHFDTTVSPMHSSVPHVGGIQPAVQQDQSFSQFPELDIRDLTFTVDDFSWLNDMNTWNVLNDT
ncbi:Zn(2)-Cys(6) zinc finger domain protein [Metarhizium robertsii]|uniref:Zn(2)-C6 fungal-type DNA-binding domain protein n=2 Tax=Metarhizium robertsii TaxID=568076 RepID=E9F1V7_METRA|nr:Zn(2)-C6 fungal-type DNA-binding domain protein [Metarhizium robertsii ARSEF 23]EFY98046.1 Zn(2)-C6 fungal-type DNA-binding domain protein [Metarhizium robertsii ARSEF 23]EXU97824.1 Zn(2)-Cys(6) zinc finger domain protein [Metarhizium robertsii]